MIYVVDTNIFSTIFKQLKPKNVFEERIYNPLDVLMKEGYLH